MGSTLREHFLFIAIAGFLSGVALASLGHASFAEAFFLLFLFLITVLYTFLAIPREKRFAFFLFAGIFLCSALGIMRSVVSDTEINARLLENVSSPIAILGTIEREPRERESYREYVVETSSGDRLLVRADMFPALSFQDRVIVRGRLDRPASFETESGRTFDYEAYLRKEGISFIVSFAHVEKLSSSGPSLSKGLIALKHAFMKRVERVIPEPESSLLGGILLGIDDAMGDDLLSAFRTVGLIHIVVLSGYNITLVAEAIQRMLSFLPRKLALGGGALSIALFTIMVGAGPSVLRASGMALLVLAARATHRTYDIARALAITAFAMVFINPLVLVYDLGFQLSFLATIALIWLAPLVKGKLGFLPERFQLREIASATIATQVFVLPLLVYAVGTISLSGFIVNLLVLPVVPAAMLFGFLTGVLGFIHEVLAFIPGGVAYLILFSIVSVTETAARLPWSGVSLPGVSALVPVVIYGSCIVVVVVKQYKTPKENKLTSGLVV